MEMCLEFLQSNIACRTKEICTLYSLLSSQLSMPQCIFILGHSNTGKTFVISNLLEYLNYKYVIINCIENPTMKHILERIINDLRQNNSSWFQLTEGKHHLKCNNIYEFINHLKSIEMTLKCNIVIVFKNCSRLRDLDPNFLASLLNLQELSDVKVCTVFIGDITWEKFKTKNEMTEPIKVYFPQYSRNEISEILLKLKKKDEEDFNIEIYELYLEIFMSIFYRFCRDLHELHYMARLNYDKYIEPIKLGHCDMMDSQFLWRNIMPVLKTNLDVIYLRISAGELTQRQTYNRDANSICKLVQSFELPFYSKYMLIAAFLASYIPSKLDKQLFRKESSRKRKQLRKQEKKSALNFAPHVFGLDRMLGIFCFIFEESVDVNSMLLTQISTLCRLGLITQVGVHQLDEIKYKCCVDYEFIYVISKMVGFDIKDFLNTF